VDRELALLIGVTRRLPRVRGAGVLANMLKRLYLRRQRSVVDADVLGFTMRLDPRECVDGEVLFYPHLCDHVEVRFMQEHLRPGDCFVDLGANIGFYSLLASRAVGERGRVIAVEADPANYQKLVGNLELNRITNVVPLCVGVSDKEESLRLGINTTGNRGGNSFLSESPTRVSVRCQPLSAILRGCEVEAVAGAKIDIEGFEYRVLDQFLKDVDPALYPRFLIVEQNRAFRDRSSGDVTSLLAGRGYEELWSSRLNHILIRRTASS
jgi:FkbM family methyltransferase